MHAQVCPEHTPAHLESVSFPLAERAVPGLLGLAGHGASLPGMRQGLHWLAPRLVHHRVILRVSGASVFSSLEWGLLHGLRENHLPTRHLALAVDVGTTNSALREGTKSRLRVTDSRVTILTIIMTPDTFSVTKKKEERTWVWSRVVTLQKWVGGRGSNGQAPRAGSPPQLFPAGFSGTDEPSPVPRTRKLWGDPNLGRFSKEPRSGFCC